jgi:L-threonylcarbamoyladenylate synthase
MASPNPRASATLLKTERLSANPVLNSNQDAHPYTSGELLDHPAIQRAAGILRANGTVAFPTETVYGLGANALSPDAVGRIFAAKARPSWDPLIVHIADISQLSQIAQINLSDPQSSGLLDLSARVQTLSAAFWPGPLTLLLPRTTAIPDEVTAGRPLVGVRLPAHPVAHALLTLAALPIAAPSANLFGHTSPTTAAHVLEDLDGRIDAVLDAGPTTVGLESTVLDPATMTLYRPGAVTPAMLTAATGLAVTIYTPPPRSTESPESLPSPGVGIRHYAPRAHLILIEIPSRELAEQSLTTALTKHEGSEAIGVLLPTNWKIPSTPTLKLYPWGNWSNQEELAQRLFAGLRALDAEGVTTILCPIPAGEGVALALRDRLEKAARTK